MLQYAYKKLYKYRNLDFVSQYASHIILYANPSIVVHSSSLDFRDMSSVSFVFFFFISYSYNYIPSISLAKITKQLDVVN
ncbi:uncharacterized protein V1518DRAFT_89027 [Limtongia smithiae]|uniref:uncharacterized protein n=1 Tax=Limtongia smithiae TaxID=1125753 RepID=UPI0034CE64F2